MLSMNAADLFAQAQEFAKKFYWGQVIKICEQGVAIEKTNARWHYLLAKAHTMRFDYAKAAKAALLGRNCDKRFANYQQKWIARESSKLFQTIDPEDAQDAINIQTKFPSQPPEWWIACYHKLFHTGAVAQAYQAKQRAAQIYVDRHELENRAPTVTYVRALVLLGAYRAAQRQAAKLAAKHAMDGKKDLNLLQLSAYSAIASGAGKSALNVLSPEGEGRAFDALVRGKSVAIVGPASTQERWGEEIESFDVVIRPGITSPMPADMQTTLGSRSDAVYYNGPDEIDHSDKIRELLQNNQIGMAVLRTPNLMSSGVYSGLSARLNSTIIKFWECDFGLLGVPKILWDVLKFSPRRIKVFNSDFYSTPTPYRDGYRADEKDNIRKRTLARHDLIENYVLCQHLFGENLFEADPKLEALLRLPLGIYLERLGVAFRSTAN